MNHLNATGFYKVDLWYSIEDLVAVAYNDTRIDLSWNIIRSGLTGICIEQSSDGINFSLIDFIGGTETSFSVIGLTTNTHYYFRLRGVKASSYSEYSNTADDWTAMKFVLTKRGDGTGRILMGSIYAGDANDIVATIDGDAKFYTNATGTTGESSSKTITKGTNTSFYAQVNSGTSNVYFFHKNNILRIGYGSGSALYGGITLSTANGPSITFTYSHLARSLTHFGISMGNQGNDLITGSAANLPPNLENLCLLSGFTMTGTCADLPDPLTYIYLGGSALSGSIAGLPTGLVFCNIAGTNTISGSVSYIPINCSVFKITGYNTISGALIDIPQGALTYFYVAGSNTISGAIADLDYSGSVLATFLCYGSNTISGAPEDISASITNFGISGNSNTFSGDIANIPATIDYFYLDGSSSSISGNISGLSEGLLSFAAYGPNTVTGDIADIPSTVTSFSIFGSNTISGNVSGFSSTIRSINIQGANTISGDISGAPDTITYIQIYGLNTISGDISGIPTNCTTFYLTGNNTLSGNLSGLGSNLRTIYVTGSNTIAGAISTIPSTITTFYITGANTISGSLSDISNSITTFVLEGNNTVDTYTSGKTWATGFIYSFTCKPVSGGGLDSTEIDNLFIDLDTSWTTTRSQLIDMRGTNAAPTAASASARASLITKGRTIYTN